MGLLSVFLLHSWQPAPFCCTYFYFLASTVHLAHMHALSLLRGFRLCSWAGKGGLQLHGFDHISSQSNLLEWWIEGQRLFLKKENVTFLFVESGRDNLFIQSIFLNTRGKGLHSLKAARWIFSEYVYLFIYSRPNHFISSYFPISAAEVSLFRIFPCLSLWSCNIFKPNFLPMNTFLSWTDIYW